MFVVNSYAVAVVLLRDHHALLGIVGQYAEVGRGPLAVRVVLLGLRVRRAADGPVVRLYAGEHGPVGPRVSWPTSARPTAANLGSALLGGMVFNAANILLVAAIAMAGMSVAFPVGIGLALVLGVLVNYAAEHKGNPSSCSPAWASSRRPSCWMPWPTAACRSKGGGPAPWAWCWPCCAGS